MKAEDENKMEFISPADSRAHGAQIILSSLLQDEGKETAADV